MSYIRTRIRNRLDFEIVACRMVKEKRRKEKKKIISHLLFFSRGRERLTKRKRGGREEGEKQDGDENRYLHNETPINQSIHGRRESLSETSTGINRRGR